MRASGSAIVVVARRGARRRRVCVAVGGGALAHAVAQGRRVLGRGVEGDPQRHALGVDEVVGAGGADLGERGASARVDELGDRSARRRRRAPWRARWRARRAAPGGSGAGVAPRRAGSAPGCAPARRSAARAGAAVDELGGAVDDRDRPPVGLLGAVAPDDEAVLGEHDEPAGGVRRGPPRDLLGEREAGPDVVDPGRLLAEAVGDEGAAVARAGERVDRVGVGVMHVRRRDERVQQGLDRGSRGGGVELAAREVGDHLLVAHRLALEAAAGPHPAAAR